MAVCPNCGAEAGSGACPRCTVGGTAPVAAPVIADNIASALCYLLLGVTGALLLFLEPYSHNRRVRFHAYQSIFVNLAIVVFWMAISFIGKRLALLVSPVFMLFCLVLWLLLMWSAWQNERLVLPLIGTMAEKQA
jgi:uncharacterized membrane protein